MKRTIVFLFIITNLLTLRAYALSAQSAVLIDSASGRVLYEKNADAKMPMASTTKIMTGLLACESGKMDKTVTVSPVASSTEGSSLWLGAGEEMSLEDLTYGLMLRSGNDAAVAIAEYLGGSTDAFALLMNKRARSIGAVNTSFKNPNGLDCEGHYTTAYDLALISREAIKNEKFAEIVSTKNKTIPWEGSQWNRTLKNHNKMLWNYKGCSGIKTGFTKKSGRCLVTSAQRNKTELICVTLNAPDDWNDHTELLNMGFNNYETKIIFKKGQRVCKYKYEKNKSAVLTAKDGFSAAMRNGEKETIKIEYKKRKLPIKKNTVCAVAHIFIDGKKIADAELVNAHEIKKQPKWQLLFN